MTRIAKRLRKRVTTESVLIGNLRKVMGSAESQVTSPRTHVAAMNELSKCTLGKPQ